MTSALLQARGLTVRRGAQDVLRGIDLEVRPAEAVALIGANGAGKSTLLHALAGLVTHGGQVSKPPLFLLPDEARPCAELTVAEQLSFHARLAGAPTQRSVSVAERLGLNPLLGARCGALSRGEARRVLLHGALLSPRSLLLLDEPLGTFDPLQVLEVVAALRDKTAEGAGLLITCHQLSDAEKFASRIVVLHDGRVLAHGTLAELQHQAGAPGAPLETVFLSLLRGVHVAA
jgi:ABC-2 type transport system ATP-binding protein